jgi:hypothetical protein
MPTLAPHLAVQITVAEPTVVGPLAVFPLIADREPSVRYVSFAEAVQRGATVKELDRGAEQRAQLVDAEANIELLIAPSARSERVDEPHVGAVVLVSGTHRLARPPSPHVGC